MIAAYGGLAVRPTGTREALGVATFRQLRPSFVERRT